LLGDHVLLLEKKVGRTDRKRPKGRIILPSSWIGINVIIAPSDKYVVVSKEECRYLKKTNDNLSLMKTVFEHLINNRSDVRKMFSIEQKTWNPVTGCLHYCNYCWARSLASAELKNSDRYKEVFHPRINVEEFRRKFKKGDFVFVSIMGDLFGDFIPREWILKVLEYTRRFPETYFVYLTKNPERYENFLNSMPKNTILGATIETNRDEMYLESKISRAALPSMRYNAMKELAWDKKFISIEPILDFDVNVFYEWIKDMSPFMVYVGYDYYDFKLPEPSLEKTNKLLEELSKTTLVVKKSIRPAYFESLEMDVRTNQNE